MKDIKEFLLTLNISWEKLEARTNFVVGTLALLFAVWIYLWARENQVGMHRYAIVVGLPVFRIINVVAALFAIVGIIRITMGFQLNHILNSGSSNKT